MVARGGGDPFSLEVIRHLPAARVVVRQAGAWRCTRHGAAVEIPRTLQGLLLARLDRLPVTARRPLPGCGGAGGLLRPMAARGGRGRGGRPRGGPPPGGRAPGGDTGCGAAEGLAGPGKFPSADEVVAAAAMLRS